MFLCFDDSLNPTATMTEVSEESTVINGRTPLAEDTAFVGWHDARALPGGFVDREVVVVVPEAGCDDPPWPALVVDADGGDVPANVLALRDRAHRRALVQYFGDSTYGWVDARQLERVDELSSATKRAVREEGVRKKAWMRAFEDMQKALNGNDSVDVHKALEDMLQKKGHKKADHEKETKKGEKGPKKRMPFPEETKEVTQKKKVKSAPVSPPKKEEKQTKTQHAAPPRQVATKPKKPATAVVQKTKASVPQNRFMIVSTREHRIGFGARKDDDDSSSSSSSEDEKDVEVPKKKAFVASLVFKHNPETHHMKLFPLCNNKTDARCC